MKGSNLGNRKRVDFTHKPFVRIDLSPMLPSPARPQKSTVTYEIEKTTFHDWKIKSWKKLSSNSFRSLCDLCGLVGFFFACLFKTSKPWHDQYSSSSWVAVNWIINSTKASSASKHPFSDAFGFCIYRKQLTCWFCTLLTFFLLQVQLLVASIYTKHSQDVCHSLHFT